MAGNDEFLRLVFEGGRFTDHSIPVDVLAELGTVNKLIEAVARALFKAKNPERQRVQRGFAAAAQMHLVASEANCFSAQLGLPKADVEKYALFADARDLALDALRSISSRTPLPTAFPADALEHLAPLGQRLGGDEGLVLQATGQTSARINQESREILANFIRRPFQRVENLEGEVISLDDTLKRFQIRALDIGRVELPFEQNQKQAILDAIAMRPIARASVRGVLLFSTPKKMLSVDEFDVVDDERAMDVQCLWKRIDSFASIPDGWIRGEGRSPTEKAIAFARSVLARLLVEEPSIPRPSVFPTPNGGVQAEWILAKWAADVSFDPTGVQIEAEATNSDTGEEDEAIFSDSAVSDESTAPLASWLKRLGV